MQCSFAAKQNEMLGQAPWWLAESRQWSVVDLSLIPVVEMPSPRQRQDQHKLWQLYVLVAVGQMDPGVPSLVAAVPASPS